uniref:hypothetical protein n=1 Tax=Gelidibacter sp. TaxID=2018083 RepID=UPI004049166C
MIEARIIKAIKILQQKDEIFLNPKFNINERSVTHRLGMYLADLFTEYDVDCEYNRVYDLNADEYIKKNIEIEVIEDGLTLEDTDARTVYPDIIIHKRGTEDNFIAIEVKMAWKKNKMDFDLIKARAYKYRLGYKHSAYLELGPFNDYTLIWIEDE